MFGRGNYFSDNWNRLDGCLVMISLLDGLITATAGRDESFLKVLRVLRLVRALRPLRVINRAPGLKLVVQTLLSSLKPISNIVIICCAFFLIFGVLGVQVHIKLHKVLIVDILFVCQLFKGLFFYCDGPNIDSQNITDKLDCLRNPQNRWINQKYNFDNIFNALMALFVLSSKDGWVDIMYHGLDAVGVDKQV